MERRPSSSALASYVNPNYIAAFFHNHCANHHVLNSGGVSSTGSGPPTSPFFVPTPPSSAPPTGRPTYFNYDMVDQSFFTSSSPLSTTGLMISSQQPTQSSSSSPSSHPVTSSPPTLRSHHHHHLPGHPISPTLSPFTSPLRHGSSLSHLSINYIASQSSTLSGSIVNAAAAAAAAAANASIGPQNSINSTIKSPTQQLTFNLTPPNSCENLHTSGWVFESIGSSTDQQQHQHQQQQHPHSLVAARSSSGEESLRIARNNEFLSDWPRSTGSKDLRRENSDINSNIDEKRAKHTLGETDNLIADQVFKFKPVDSNNSLAFRPHNIISSGNDKNNNNITRCESPSSSSATTSPSMMNQNCSSPSHVPKGKEGSRKHRILRPPDIQIDHRSRESLHSVAGKELAPMSAPPFDSIRDIQRSRFPYSPVPLTSETSDGGSKNTSQHIVPSVANTLARRKEADDAAIISQNSSTFSPSFCHKNRSKPEKLPHSPRVNGHPAKPKSRNQGTINTPRTTSCSAQSTKTSNQGGNILSRSRKVHVQFQKGSLIQLGDGRKKPIEEMVTQDFFRSALLSPNLSIDSSRIVALKENIENCSIWITFEMRNSDSPEIQDQSSSSRNFHPMTTTPAVQISGPSTRYYTIEAPMEHPFFVHERGWCSFSPHQTLLVYGLECKKLGEGDTCLSLVRKTHHHQLKKNPHSSREPQRTITSSPKRDQVSSNQQNHVLSQAQLTQPAHHQGMLGNSHAGHETQSPKDYQQKEVQDLSITGNRDSPSQQEQQRPSPSVLPQVVRSPQPENDPPSDEKSLLNSINKKRRHSAPDVVSEKMTTVVDDNSGKSIAEADSNSPSIKDSRQTVDSKAKEKEEEEEDEIEVEEEEGKEKDELHHERKRKA